MGNLRYNKGQGQEENWLIEESSFDVRYLAKCESIFCQGNGYMGIRNALEEAYVTETRDMFVSGTFNQFDETEVTELPNLPDVTNMKLFLNGRAFSMTEGTLSRYSRVLNLRNGEVTRRVKWRSSQGEQAAFSFQRTVSLSDRHALASKVKIQPLSGPMTIRVLSGIDGTVSNSGAQHLMEGEKRLYDGCCLEYLSRTTRSRIPAATYAAHRFFLDGREIQPKLLPVINRRQILIDVSIELPAGSVLTVEKTAAVYTGRDLEFKNCGEKEKAVRHTGQEKIRALHQAGYEDLQKESAAAWQQFWEEQDIRIETEDGFDQLALRFALYHMNIMANHEDNRTGIGAKALSGEGYKGHSFWDTEVFLLPYYMLTQPSIAKNLLEYRYQGLEGARKKAAEYGYEGAMYPWEAAWIDDGEVTPLYGPADVVTGKPLIYLTGMIEQHISADIAFAVWQYYLASKDETFLMECGYEMIFDTARFWLSRLEYNEAENRYEIHDVIGPDEYKEHVNNDVYTNYLTWENLILAKKSLGRLRQAKSEKEKETLECLEKKLNLKKMEEEMAKKLDRFYLPAPDEKTGIIPQFDGYFDLEYLDISRFKESSQVLTIYKELGQEEINRYQISKQGDLVVLFYLLGDFWDRETKEKNYRFYEARTTHDSSLSLSTHSVVASSLGMADEAYRLYQASCKVDLGEEMCSSDAGIHAASMGGIWQAAVQGFGGVRVTDKGLWIDPKLPKTCSHLAFPLCWQGSHLQIDVTKGRLVIENRGEPVTAILKGQERVLYHGSNVIWEDEDEV